MCVCVCVHLHVYSCNSIAVSYTYWYSLYLSKHLSENTNEVQHFYVLEDKEDFV